MDFRFKLYRILTGLTLMISGFFTFLGLFLTLTGGGNIAMMVSLMVWGACFIHSVLSLYLQRSLLLPEVPLKENTPGGIRIMGVITLIFGALLFMAGFTLQASTPEMMKDILLNMPQQEQGVINPGVLKAVGAVCLVISLLLIFNTGLSFRYLRIWQQRGEDRHDEADEN